MYLAEHVFSFSDVKLPSPEPPEVVVVTVFRLTRHLLHRCLELKGGRRRRRGDGGREERGRELYLPQSLLLFGTEVTHKTTHDDQPLPLSPADSEI